MSIKQAIKILTMILSLATSIQFSSYIMPGNQSCFFQILAVDQKYRVDIYPSTGSLYTLSIQSLNKQSKQWQTQYYRKQVNITQSLNVHKLATRSSSYKFCVKNNDLDQNLNYYINIESGLQLLQLHLLPDNSDTENMILEMQQIKEQTKKLKQKLDKINFIQSQTQILNSLLQGKIFVWVLVFSIIFIVLNGFFYMRIKKNLNQRKMI